MLCKPLKLIDIAYLGDTTISHQFVVVSGRRHLEMWLLHVQNTILRCRQPTRVRVPMHTAMTTTQYNVKWQALPIFPQIRSL